MSLFDDVAFGPKIEALEQFTCEECGELLTDEDWRHTGDLVVCGDCDDEAIQDQADWDAHGLYGM